MQEKLGAINCDLKGDGSVHFEDCDINASETTTRPLGYNDMQRTIIRLCSIMAKVEATSNRSCGIHFHTSNKKFLKSRNLKRIISTWLAIEDVLFATQPNHRLNNHYCQRVLGRFITGSYPETLPQDKSEFMEASRHIDRYSALNLNALSLHGTLEVRLFANTLNAQKLLAYLELLRAIWDYALTRYDHNEIQKFMLMDISDTKVQKVWKLLKLSEGTAKLLTERVQKSLFASLQNQQKSANSYLQIKDKAEAIRRRYNAISHAYSRVQDELAELSRPFATRSY